ncbi:MAG: HEPN domain-containing protein, partial [Alphaproteobacteria bacterium]
MTPEASAFLAKAQHLLAEADTMLSVGLNDAAGRTAYLAGFHAAQALIFERVGKVFKSHRGVQTEFLRLTKDDPNLAVA